MYREIQIHKTDSCKRYQHSTARLKISGFSPVKLAQKIEREILENFFFKT